MTDPNFTGGSPPGGHGYPSGGIPYPQMPPTQGGGEPPASGGTAITAGVLAVLGGLFIAVASWVTFDLVDFVTRGWSERGIPFAGVSELASLLPDWLSTYTTLAGIGYAVAALLLLVGSCLMLMRSMAGRWMVVAGCVVVIGVAVAGMIAGPAAVTEMVDAAQARFGSRNGAPSPSLSVAGPTVFVIIMPALATLILALVPLTGRWIDGGRHTPRPPQPQQAYPSYPHPPGQW